MKYPKTALFINPEVREKGRRYAAAQGISLSQLVENLLNNVQISSRPGELKMEFTPYSGPTITHMQPNASGTAVPNQVIPKVDNFGVSPTK